MTRNGAYNCGKAAPVGDTAERRGGVVIECWSTRDGTEVVLQRGAIRRLRKGTGRRSLDRHDQRNARVPFCRALFRSKSHQ